MITVEFTEQEAREFKQFLSNRTGPTGEALTTVAVRVRNELAKALTPDVCGIRVTVDGQPLSCCLPANLPHEFHKFYSSLGTIVYVQKIS